MKVIKITALIAVVLLSFGLYNYFTDNKIITTTANNNPKITTATGEEYKTPLGDKDTTAETNKQVILQLSAVTEQIKELNKKIVDNKQQITNLTNNKQLPINNISNNSKKPSLLENIKDKVNKIPIIKEKKQYPINSSVNTGYTWNATILSHKVTTTLNSTQNISSTKTYENTQTIIPKYTIPANSVLGGVLTTGLLGRIPINGEITEPYRFSMQITDKAFFANYKSSNDLEGMVLSGTAKGDLLLSCVKAIVDSITFIFYDGTISQNKGVDIAEVIDEFGYPCIKGKLITNAVEYLSIGTTLSGLSSAATAFAQEEQTVSTDSSGNTTRNVTGDATKFAGYNALAGGVSNIQKWLDDRAKSSFDVIFVPSGKKVKLSVLNSIAIDYDINGRKLNHLSSITQQGVDGDLD